MRGQIRGLNQASTNAQDGISMIQTAEGAMNELHSVVQRMRELTVQAANDTNVAEDRMAIQSEIKQLSEEIDRIAQSTEFNTMKLLNGDYSEDGERGKLTLQVGANNSSTDVLDDGDQVIKFSLNAMTTDVIGGETGTVSALFMLTIDDATGFEDADIAASIAADLDILDEALKYVSDERSKLGAIQNR